MPRSSTIRESDWKTFRKLRALALDRFCVRSLDEVQTLCKAADRSAHERYRDVFGLMAKRDREIERLFDPHTRSRATLQLIALCEWQLIGETELEELSDDLQTTVKEMVHEFGPSEIDHG